jgi:hypothetical protein
VHYFFDHSPAIEKSLDIVDSFFQVSSVMSLETSNNFIHMMDFKSSPNAPAIGAVISGNTAFTSLSYHESGKTLFAASEGDSRLQVVDCINGQMAQQPLRCEREGISLVEAT